MIGKKPINHDAKRILRKFVLKWQSELHRRVVKSMFMETHSLWMQTRPMIAIGSIQLPPIIPRIPSHDCNKLEICFPLAQLFQLSAAQ